jgi:hypothetical protein
MQTNPNKWETVQPVTQDTPPAVARASSTIPKPGSIARLLSSRPQSTSPIKQKEEVPAADTNKKRKKKKKKKNAVVRVLESEDAPILGHRSIQVSHPESSNAKSSEATINSEAGAEEASESPKKKKGKKSKNKDKMPEVQEAKDQSPVKTKRKQENAELSASKKAKAADGLPDAVKSNPATFPSHCPSSTSKPSQPKADPPKEISTSNKSSQAVFTSDLLFSKDTDNDTMFAILLSSGLETTNPSAFMYVNKLRSQGTSP